MRSKEVPFNVELLKLTPAQLGTMQPVTSVDFFAAANGELHEQGLFSIPIFGRIGSEERDQRFSYIDIKLQVLHPIIYARLIKLKSMYEGIISGTQHAVWDAKLKDFVTSDEVNGHTGFSFFMQHWKQIQFVRNDSAVREMRIRLIEKYRDRATTSKIVVLPAGLRDIEVGDDGRTKYNDINPLYRKLISIASTIPDTDHLETDPTYDLSRLMLQNTFNELYAFIEQLLTGKSGFIQDKWASRGVFNSTRNVITAADLSTEFLGSPNSPKYTDSTMGLHQLTRMLLPITIHRLRTGHLKDVFSHGDNRALLVDPKTLSSEVVDIAPKSFDRWNTAEGLERVIASYGEVSIRDRPVMIEDRYLALIYRGPDMTFRIFNDISELPAGFDKKYVYPISLVELLYLAGYQIWNNYIGFNTRYPVAGLGSCYPFTVRVKTTIVGEIRRELGPDWSPYEGDEYLALEYPILPAKAYLDSYVVNTGRLSGLAADFDGDTMSSTLVYSDEALQEQRAYLKSKAAFADPRGGLLASAAVPTVELVVLNMLGRV